MRSKPRLANLLPPDSKHMGEPITLTGSDIGDFAKSNGSSEMHLTEISLALGINTAALYTKKKSAQRLSSSVSLLLRMYSAFPDYVPRLLIPAAEELTQKIIKIDPSFKKSHTGPLLGLETNSSFRLIKDSDKASQTVKNMIYLIDKLITDDPQNWFVVKEIVELEARARQIDPPDSVWPRGGWTRSTGRPSKNDTPLITAKPPRHRTTTDDAAEPIPSTAKPLKRKEK